MQTRRVHSASVFPFHLILVGIIHVITLIYISFIIFKEKKSDAQPPIYMISHFDGNPQGPPSLSFSVFS